MGKRRFGPGNASGVQRRVGVVFLVSIAIFQIINIHYDVVIVLNLSKMHWYILRSKSIVAIIYTLYEFIIRFTFPISTLY